MTGFTSRPSLTTDASYLKIKQDFPSERIDLCGPAQSLRKVRSMAAADPNDLLPDRAQHILDYVWPVMRRPLAPFLVIGSDVLDAVDSIGVLRTEPRLALSESAYKEEPKPECAIDSCVALPLGTSRQIQRPYDTDLQKRFLEWIDWMWSEWTGFWRKQCQQQRLSDDDLITMFLASCASIAAAWRNMIPNTQQRDICPSLTYGKGLLSRRE